LVLLSHELREAAKTRLTGGSVNARLANLVSAALTRSDNDGLIDIVSRCGFMIGEHGCQFRTELSNESMVSLATELETLYELKHDAGRWTKHIQAAMQGVLTCDQACELLTADSFNPGPRTSAVVPDTHGIRQPLFKECPKRRLKGEPGADRWRNSGGEKGSSFLRNK